MNENCFLFPNPSSIINAGLPGNTLFVALSWTQPANEGKQFTSISTALSSVSGATQSNPIVIIVYPGTYNENITLVANVSIIGIAPNSVNVGSITYNPPNGGDFSITLQNINCINIVIDDTDTTSNRLYTLNTIRISQDLDHRLGIGSSTSVAFYRNVFGTNSSFIFRGGIRYLVNGHCDQLISIDAGRSFYEQVLVGTILQIGNSPDITCSNVTCNSLSINQNSTVNFVNSTSLDLTTVANTSTLRANNSNFQTSLTVSGAANLLGSIVTTFFSGSGLLDLSNWITTTDHSSNAVQNVNFPVETNDTNYSISVTQIGGATTVDFVISNITTNGYTITSDITATNLEYSHTITRISSSI